MTSSFANAQNRVDAGKDPWQGPLDERNQLGKKTGEKIVRCRFCTIECPVADKEFATHQEGCPVQ